MVNLRTLVVYYSRSGRRATIAEALSGRSTPMLRKWSSPKFGLVFPASTFAGAAIDGILLLLPNPNAILRPMIVSSYSGTRVWDGQLFARSRPDG